MPRHADTRIFLVDSIERGRDIRAVFPSEKSAIKRAGRRKPRRFRGSSFALFPFLVNFHVDARIFAVAVAFQIRIIRGKRGREYRESELFRGGCLREALFAVKNQDATFRLPLNNAKTWIFTCAPIRAYQCGRHECPRCSCPGLARYDHSWSVLR